MNYDIESFEILIFHHLLQHEALTLINDGLSDEAISDLVDEFIDQWLDDANLDLRPR